MTRKIMRSRNAQCNTGEWQSLFSYMFSWYSDIFFETKFKKIDLTRGWLEVDLGSRLARV